MNARTITVIAAAALCLAPWVASAAVGIVENFNDPPLTGGTAGGSFEDGFVSGDNGWVLVSDIPGGTNFGQRDDGLSSFGGTFDNGIANLRARGGTTDSFLVRQLHATGDEIIQGTISFDIVQSLVGFSETGLELILLGNTGATTALALELGDISQVASFDNRFEVQTTGGGTVIADDTTLTTAGDPLNWTDGSFNSTGDYVSFHLAFNTGTDLATITLTTTDGVGTTSSTTPFNVAMTDIGGAIDQVTLRLFVPRNGNGTGSLAFLDNYVIDATIPEPSTLAMLAIGAGLLSMRRKQHGRGV